MNILDGKEVMDMENQEAENVAAILQAERDAFNQSIEGVIIKAFHNNRDARKYSGIEDSIRDSALAYNGEYSKQDKQRLLEEGGSRIYMNLTATKVKVAKAWISDILLPAGEKAYSIKSTPLPSLPSDIVDQINKAIKEDVDALKAINSNEEPVQGKAETAQETIKKTNKTKRDIKAALLNEIKKESDFEVKLMEKQIDDQLQEGGWDNALLDFIDDVCIYPNAFMKGPIISKRKKLSWVDGKPDVQEDYVFLNKRVSPWDIYPSPVGSSIEDGDFIEHTRYTLKDIQALKGVPGYDDIALNKVMEDPFRYSWLDTGIEQDKDEVELKNNSHTLTENEIHGLHFFGSLKVKTIMEWPGASNILVSKLMSMMPEDVVDVEAIMISNKVVKVVINENPLGKRPYYTASYMNIPGSFWGRSLPSLMSDIQRMCNATSRSLANNLSISCLTGDTIVYRPRSRGLSEVTIKELFDKKGKYNSGLKRTKLRCLDEDSGELYHNKVIDVVYNGESPVYEIKTSEGYKIRATGNHRFMKDDGDWDFVDNFVEGDLIAVNGSPQKRTKLCVDCGCPITARAQRCKSCHTAYWNETQREMARSDYWSASETTARQRKDCLDARKDYCEECGVIGTKFEIHHKDVNPMNTSTDNLINLCIPCHNKAHVKINHKGDGYLKKYVTYDEIVSIKYVGVEGVYDLQMDSPNHNFIANGFVSHNSGPQAEVKVDLLADSGDIDEMTPFKIWQTVSDPTGGGSQQAVRFFQPSSNASELLAVYDKFEVRADDVTGIPRYAYGNDKLAGAGTTVGGLSLLLESTSKIIKDTIRNIDTGLIKPRVETQFYYNLLKNTSSNFTGDIEVVATGSSILTVKAAQRLRQNEFLQITSNAVDQKIMGYSGRANMLREISEGMGLAEDIIPTALELSKMEAEDAKMQAQAAKMEQEKIRADHEASLAATQIQIQGQKDMSQLTQQVKSMKAQSDAEAKKVDQQLKLLEINTKAATDAMKGKSYENAAAITASNKKDIQMNEMVYKSKVSPDNKGI